MEGTVRNVLAASVTLFLLSCATCHYGPPYALGQLSPEEREMADFVACGDVVGDEWLNLGGFILLVSFSTAIAAALLWSRQNSDFSVGGLTTLRITQSRPPHDHGGNSRLPDTSRRTGSTIYFAPTFAHFDKRGRTPLERVLLDG